MEGLSSDSEEVLVPTNGDASGLYPISILDPDVQYGLPVVHYFDTFVEYLTVSSLTREAQVGGGRGTLAANGSCGQRGAFAVSLRLLGSNLSAPKRLPSGHSLAPTSFLTSTPGLPPTPPAEQAGLHVRH